MDSVLNDIIAPPPQSPSVPPDATVCMSGGVDREVFPGYMTDGNFPQTIVHPIHSWDRPADYIPGRMNDAWVRVNLVYWNQKKLEEGKLFVCAVGEGRNEKRLERLLSLAYRVENVLSHGKKAIEELKGLFKQIIG